MIAYLLRRLAQAVLLLLGVLVFTFLLIHLAPGDPIYALAGESADAAYYAQMRARFGLDRPLHEQLATYVANVLRGDFGHSYVHKQPVFAVILPRVPPTLLLLATALVVSTAAGVWLGAHAARHAGTPGDAAIRAGTVLATCAPAFWLGQILMLVFAVGLGWFPIQGMVDVRANHRGPALALDIARHLALPAATLILIQLALVTRLARSGVRAALDDDYARTAHAKGLSPRAVVYRHALPNAVLPIVTVVGAHVGTLLTGAVLTEIVFAWPGLGRLLYDATLSRDYPLLMALFEASAALVIAANLATDLVYALLDPRVRYR